MQLLDAGCVFSATDLNNYLACTHLTALDLAVLRGEAERPSGRSEQAQLLSKLGEEHEFAYFTRLQADGAQIVTIERASGLDGIRAAAIATEEAMAAGADVIYQATFFDGTWVGHADFLRKINEQREGGRWPWHYEVEDTKLARHTEPYFVLQLAYYSEHVGRIQGCAPQRMHVVLGNGNRESFRVEDFAAYYRSVKRRFLEWVANGAEDSYPVPVDHCNLCPWNSRCEQQRLRDDHLSLVANITRLQTTRLEDAGIRTLRALAAAAPEHKPDKMETSTFAKLRRQARLQEEQRTAIAAGDPNPYKYEILEDGLTEQRGFFRLPQPAPGDVFFDMEGDPYYDIGTGLEYLFGAHTPEGEFHAFWGCDRSERPSRDRLAEKHAFENFIDFVMARRERDPEMHIYHYASYEKTALQKLSLRHATRENEVDAILREDRLVDLYAIVRQAIAVGQPSYSIKKIEEFYGKRGSESKVLAGDDSILRFEEWLALRTDLSRRNDAILDELKRYNEYDCVSTRGLRDWMLHLRSEAARQFGIDIPPYEGKVVETPEREERFVELKAALDARIPDDFDPSIDDPRFAPSKPYFLARHMLDYHWREQKPVYWRFHDRCETYWDDAKMLIDDAESILGLEQLGEPIPVKKSFRYDFRFPRQLHKIEAGDACFDLGTKAKAGQIIEIEDGEEYGALALLRGPILDGVPIPSAITVRNIVQPYSILDAIVRFAQLLLDEGPSTRYRAAFDILTAERPRIRGVPRGTTIQPDQADEASLRALCDALEESYLFVQGPPGAGKTYLGARMIVDLLARKRRVGITANSHKAIHNLLDEIVRVAAERHVEFVALKKCNRKDPETLYPGARIQNVDDTLAHDDADLVAGTAWAFGPEEMDQRLDYVFIDEAGQVCLPHAIAVATAAKNVVLLGDPLQLPQVAHTQHPGDLGASVLEHLLNHELRPVAPDRGVLLPNSYRMHPDVCRFVSELLYEGKLHAAAGRELQRVDSSGLGGAGLRYFRVDHSGNSQRSIEEAECISAEIERLLIGNVTDSHGITRPLCPHDIIVVTPYNAQVRSIRRALEARRISDVEVGTVDKFQGREAFVVFYSTAASTPEDAPRGLGFVFDRQRVNVAISRARALAIMVSSPRLLKLQSATLEDARVANGLYRFIEDAPDRTAPSLA